MATFKLQFRTEVARLTNTTIGLIVVNAVYAGSTLVNATMPSSAATLLAAATSDSAQSAALDATLFPLLSSATTSSGSSSGSSDAVLIISVTFACAFLLGLLVLCIRATCTCVHKQQADSETDSLKRYRVALAVQRYNSTTSLSV